MSRAALADERRALHKQRAAEYAVTFVQSGMVVGLGTGSTATFAVRALARVLREARVRDVVAVPSSDATAALARELGIALISLEDTRYVDLTIDGADEVDPGLNLIKGAGGALLREKILAQASEREMIVVDESKLSAMLGTRALPVEVIEFGWRRQLDYLESLGARVELRRAADDHPFETEHGNLILDCTFGPLAQLEPLASQLGARAGIVEHGLFIGLATDLVTAGESGVRHTERRRS